MAAITAKSKQKMTTVEIVYCGMFAALMAVGAFIKIMIPLGVFEVTFSLQFFFALLAGFFLGAKRGFTSVLVYLIIGLIGVPVFAHGGGPAYVLKPTFGFLIGFAFAALVKWFIMRADSCIITLCSISFCRTAHRSPFRSSSVSGSSAQSSRTSRCAWRRPLSQGSFCRIWEF